MRECVKTQNSEKPPLPIDGSDPLRHQTTAIIELSALWQRLFFTNGSCLEVGF